MQTTALPIHCSAFSRWLMPEAKTWFLAFSCHWMQSLLKARWPGDDMCAQTMWLTRLLAFLQHTTETVHRLGDVVLWLMTLVGERVSSCDNHMPSEASCLAANGMVLMPSY